MERLDGVYAARRAAVMDRMGAHSLMVLYSGEGVPASMDDRYPFEANHHFFYLCSSRSRCPSMSAGPAAA